VHDLFTPHHACNYKITEGEWHPVRLLVRLKYIELTVVQIKYTPVFYQRLQLARVREINFP
jgi:hypothetical protein